MRSPCNARAADNFFLERVAQAEIRTRLLNLEERLILYRIPQMPGEVTQAEVASVAQNGRVRQTPCYGINPLLQKALSTVAGLNLFLIPQKRMRPSAQLLTTDLMLCALYSFFTHGENLLKVDGTFRKKAFVMFQALFPVDPDVVSVALPAYLQRAGEERGTSRLLQEGRRVLEHLGLIVCESAQVHVQDKRWASFFSLTALERAVYLTVASTAILRKEVLVQRAQALRTLLCVLHPDAQYAPEDLTRVYRILVEEAAPSVAADFFSSLSLSKDTMLQKRKGALHDSSVFSMQSAITAIRTAQLFGLLCVKDGLCALNEALFKGQYTRGPGMVLSATAELTIFPDGDMQGVLPILSCAHVCSLQTVATFELNKKSCTTGFARGLTVQALAQALECKTGEQVPQNILSSFRQWYAQITALTLRRGFVMQVDSSQQAFFESGGPLHPLVRTRLAEGVYFFDECQECMLYQALARARLSYLCEPIDTATPLFRPGEQGARALHVPSFSFPVRSARGVSEESTRDFAHLGAFVLETPNVSCTHSAADTPSISEQTGGVAHVQSEEDVDPSTSGATGKYWDKAQWRKVQRMRRAVRLQRLKEFEAHLQQLKLDATEQTELRARLQRGLILDRMQLSSETIRRERTEASGVDFLGKYRLAECALRSGALLEIETSSGQSVHKIVGTVCAIEKCEEDALLHVCVHAELPPERVSIARASDRKSVV